MAAVAREERGAVVLPSRRRNANHDPVAHAIQEFAGGCSFMAELEGNPRDVGVLVEKLLLAMNHQARAKPHPVLYVSSAITLTAVLALIQGALIFGSLQARVAVLEGKTQGIESVAAKVDGLAATVNRMADRLEKLQDERRGPTK